MIASYISQGKYLSLEILKTKQITLGIAVFVLLNICVIVGDFFQISIFKTQVYQNKSWNYLIQINGHNTFLFTNFYNINPTHCYIHFKYNSNAMSLSLFWKSGIVSYD